MTVQFDGHNMRVVCSVITLMLFACITPASRADVTFATEPDFYAECTPLISRRFSQT